MSLPIFLLFFTFNQLFAAGFTPFDKKCTSNSKEMLQFENGQKMEYTKILCKYGHRKHLDFFLIGDIGGKDFTNDGGQMDFAPTLGQLAVAMGMAKSMEEENKNAALHKFRADFVVNVGDNFYPFGLINEADAKERFRKIVQNVYTPSNGVGKNGLHIPWYTIAGNSDYYLPPERRNKLLSQKMFNEEFEEARKQINLQIAYSRNVDIWEFPAPYYLVEHEFIVDKNEEKEKGKMGKKIRVILVMIDTILLGGLHQRDFTQNPSEEKMKAKMEHEKWVEAVLKEQHESKADYIFVAGHYPVHLNEGDKSAFPCLPFLQNLFKKYEVSAYFAGHEHSLLHLVKDGVHHVVSGAASRMQNCWPNYLRFGDAQESQHSLLGATIKTCYPDGLTTEQQAKNRAELKKWMNEKNAVIKPRPGSTNLSTLGPRIEAFDGGAFVRIRVDAKMAELEFWAAGGNIYPGGNVEEIRKGMDTKNADKMPEKIECLQGKDAEEEKRKFMAKNLKIKLLDKTQIKSKKTKKF